MGAKAKKAAPQDDVAASYPTRLQLASWFVFDHLQETPAQDIAPEIIADWYEQAMLSDALTLHAQYYREYDDFRQQFVPPHDIKAKDVKSSLTRREIDVLQRLMEGDNNQDIASHLTITKETVKTHIQTIFQKLGVSDRVKAAIWALRNGIEYL